MNAWSIASSYQAQTQWCRGFSGAGVSICSTAHSLSYLTSIGICIPCEILVSKFQACSTVMLMLKRYSPNHRFIPDKIRKFPQEKKIPLITIFQCSDFSDKKRERKEPITALFFVSLWSACSSLDEFDVVVYVECR